LALDDIRVRENVRDLDVEHVESLARSIALRGLLVPLIVRVVDDGQLVGIVDDDAILRIVVAEEDPEPATGAGTHR